MAKKPTLSQTIDQITLTQDELDEVIAILNNANISADKKVVLLAEIVLPKDTANEG